MTGSTQVLWRRAVAHGLDGLPALLPAYGVAVATDSAVAFFITYVLGWLLFYVALQAYTGFTAGKWLLGIRTVDAAGNAPGLLAIVKRTLPLVLEVTYLIGIFAIWSHPLGQRFGDRWADTYVVRSPRRTAQVRPVGLTG